jgi:uncharacterized sulfatase
MRGAQYARLVDRLKPSERRDPLALKLPPYYPDTEPSRRDWANYYELITAMDYQAGDRIREIEEAGLLEDTVIFFWGDHGVGLPRAKRWLYESGTHVPLVARIPKKFRTGDQGRPGTEDSQLVSFLDLAPSMLNLAGVEIQKHMQGRAFLGPNLSAPRRYVHAARDRMDARYDCVRMVRGPRYRYLRNYRPDLPYAQQLDYMEQGFIMKELRAGRIPEAARLFMGDRKPVEELYDVHLDPHELRNLVDSPQHQRILVEMRAEHERWSMETRDLGLIPEPIVAEREKELGNRYAILVQPGSEEYLRRLRAVVDAVNRGKPAPDSDPDPAIRWWLARSTSDPHPAVRVAAARKSRDIAVLTRELASDNEWVRLAAANALDELGASEPLRSALQDKNDYVRKIAEHGARP